MENKPRVSIIIPTYNGEQYLFETLSSVYAQTFKDWQAVIVVDGSTDETLSRFEKSVFSEDSRFRIISQQNMGVSRARNVGLDLCESDYVAFLDHDDIWHPTKLERQFRFLEENRTFLACTCWYLTSKKVEGGYSHSKLFSYQSFDSMMGNWISFSGNGPALASSLLMRRNDDELRFSDEYNAIGDLDFISRLLLVGRVAVIKTPLMLYVQHKNQMHMRGNLISDYVNFYANIHESTVRQFRLNRKNLNAKVNAHLNLIRVVSSLSKKPNIRTCFRLIFSREIWNLTLLTLIVSMIRKRVAGYFARVRYGGMIKALWNT